MAVKIFIDSYVMYLTIVDNAQHGNDSEQFEIHHRSFWIVVNLKTINRKVSALIQLL